MRTEHGCAFGLWAGDCCELSGCGIPFQYGDTFESVIYDFVALATASITKLSNRAQARVNVLKRTNAIQGVSGV